MTINSITQFHYDLWNYIYDNSTEIVNGDAKLVDLKKRYFRMELNLVQEQIDKLAYYNYCAGCFVSYLDCYRCPIAREIGNCLSAGSVYDAAFKGNPIAIKKIRDVDFTKYYTETEIAKFTLKINDFLEQK